MSRNLVSIDRFGDEVEAILEEYGREVAEMIPEAADYASKYAKTKLAATSPRRGGKYAVGWKVTSESYGVGSRSVVYNAKKPGLTHLLANGHALRRGGRTIGKGWVDSKHDIASVNDQTQEIFIERLETLAQRG